MPDRPRQALAPAVAASRTLVQPVGEDLRSNREQEYPVEDGGCPRQRDARMGIVIRPAVGQGECHRPHARIKHGCHRKHQAGPRNPRLARCPGWLTEMHARIVHTSRRNPSAPAPRSPPSPPRPVQRQSQGCVTQRHGSWRGCPDPADHHGLPRTCHSVTSALSPAPAPAPETSPLHQAPQPGAEERAHLKCLRSWAGGRRAVS